jgi:hypothetical protein
MSNDLDAENKRAQPYQILQYKIAMLPFKMFRDQIAKRE